MDRNFEKAAAARRAYQREWRAKNRDRVRAYNQRYWERRGEKLAKEGTEHAEAQNNH